MKRRLLILSAVLFLSSCFTAQGPAPVARYGASQGAGSAGIHTVIGGDTLYSISQRYNLAMRDIALANGLQPPFALAPGLRLRLPPPQTYKTRKGDTLYSVSRLFGVNTSEIAALNRLPAPYTLKAGQSLRLPTITRKTQPAPKPVSMARAAPVTAVEIAPLPEALPKGAVPRVQSEPYETARAVPVKPAEPKSKVTAATPKRSSAKFLQPVSGPVISSYGPKENGQHNDGINIRAPKGAPVLAAENGVVVYAGNELKGSGNLVLIRHDGRWMTAYAHMDSISIRRGDIIRRGQAIGTVGTTGSVDTPQLHFEVRRGTEAINPRPYLEG